MPRSRLHVPTRDGEWLVRWVDCCSEERLKRLGEVGSVQGQSEAHRDVQVQQARHRLGGTRLAWSNCNGEKWSRPQGKCSPDPCHRQGLSSNRRTTLPAIWDMALSPPLLQLRDACIQNDCIQKNKNKPLSSAACILLCIILSGWFQHPVHLL